MTDVRYDAKELTFGEPDEILGYAVLGRDDGEPDGFGSHVADDSTHVLWLDGDGEFAIRKSHACWDMYEHL